MRDVRKLKEGTVLTGAKIVPPRPSRTAEALQELKKVFLTPPHPRHIYLMPAAFDERQPASFDTIRQCLLVFYLHRRAFRWCQHQHWYAYLRQERSRVEGAQKLRILR